MICRTILNETSYFGKGAIKEIANEVINRGLKKVMLVTDKDLLKFKVATKVCDILDEAKIDYEIFESVNVGFSAAKARCLDSEMIFIGGSNFVVGEFLEKNLSESQ